jgi:flagellin-like hook-associated protein FlgL
VASFAHADRNATNLAQLHNATQSLAENELTTSTLSAAQVKTLEAEMSRVDSNQTSLTAEMNKFAEVNQTSLVQMDEISASYEDIQQMDAEYDQKEDTGDKEDGMP